MLDIPLLDAKVHRGRQQPFTGFLLSIEGIVLVGVMRFILAVDHGWDSGPVALPRLGMFSVIGGIRIQSSLLPDRALLIVSETTVTLLKVLSCIIE